MVKKLNKLALDAGENQMASAIRDSAQQIWLAGLGAFAKAQEGGTKVFEALIREGESLQSRTKEAAAEKVTEMTSRATGTWDRLEKVFEDRVARALHSLGVPTKQDVQTLTRRVHELTAMVQQLAEGEAAQRKPAPRRRSAAK